MKVEYIAIHCSATENSNAKIYAKDIEKWHLDNGWDRVGYHYVIPRDGWIEVGRMEQEDGAHVKGFNAVALGICLVGGLTDGKPDPAYTKAQWSALARLVRSLKLRYPKAIVQGHRDFPAVNKDCPCFDVKEWWERINK